VFQAAIALTTRYPPIAETWLDISSHAPNLLGFHVQSDRSKKPIAHAKHPQRASPSSGCVEETNLPEPDLVAWHQPRK
jgi:hypothetical protein